MNHELAGESLTFEVEIIEVRQANDEEISSGIIIDQLSSLVIAVQTVPVLIKSRA